MVALRIQRMCDEWLGAVGDPGADPVRVITAARRAWDDLVRRRGWSPSYAVRIRSAVVAWLIATGRPDFVRALRVNHRVPPPQRIVHTESSHERIFALHDCLPRAVRATPPGGMRYRLLEYVAERLLACMRSACRRSMQKRMLVVDRLLFAPPALVDVPHDDDDGAVTDAEVVAAVAVLRRLRADEWLRRLECAYPDRSAWARSSFARTSVC